MSPMPCWMPGHPCEVSTKGPPTPRSQSCLWAPGSGGPHPQLQCYSRRTHSPGQRHSCASWCQFSSICNKAGTHSVYVSPTHLLHRPLPTQLSLRPLGDDAKINLGTSSQGSSGMISLGHRASEESVPSALCAALRPSAAPSEVCPKWDVSRAVEHLHFPVHQDKSIWHHSLGIWDTWEETSSMEESSKSPSPEFADTARPAGTGRALEVLVLSSYFLFLSPLTEMLSLPPAFKPGH